MSYVKNKSIKNRNNILNKKYVILVLFFIIVLFISLVYASNRKDSTVSNESNNEAKTTSTAPTAQEDFNEGDERTIVETDQNRGDAIVSDNQGVVEEIPQESEWIVSSSGEISLYSPTNNQLIKNGDYISGQSSLPIVSFRLIDDVSGVISMGQLSVVNGQFSGVINFSTTASTGRLDVFGTKDDGAEFSNVEVPVRFR